MTKTINPNNSITPFGSLLGKTPQNLLEDLYTRIEHEISIENFPELRSLYRATCYLKDLCNKGFLTESEKEILFDRTENLLNRLQNDLVDVFHIQEELQNLLSFLQKNNLRSKICIILSHLHNLADLHSPFLDDKEILKKKIHHIENLAKNPSVMDCEILEIIKEIEKVEDIAHKTFSSEKEIAQYLDIIHSSIELRLSKRPTKENPQKK